MNAPANAGSFIPKGYFHDDLATADTYVMKAIKGELHRQQDQIELIASENIVSKAVLEAQGSVLTNKYAEGYPGRRYYGGCEYVDDVERIAIDRAKQLFNCAFANVQPHSGANANQAVFFSLLQPGDTYMGMDLACGGHLTHGSPANQSGKWFTVVPYGVTPGDNTIDMDQVESLAKQHKPKLIIAGASNYPRHIDFARFREIADMVGAYLFVDMAHYAGLVAGGVYPDPLPHAHVVTTTTHKTLRGPRGGLILSNDEALGKKINSAVFPGLQGGPLMHVIAGKAVAFGEALQPEFKAYAAQIVANARVLADTLISRGLAIVTGGTDSHVMSVDLRPMGQTGKATEAALEAAFITCNKNGIPYDPQPFTITSGVRLGTPAGTTRGFREAEFAQIGHLIADVVEGMKSNSGEPDPDIQAKVRAEVTRLTGLFPIYS